ncbi:MULTISPECIES: hypothetical protein [Bacillus cereus group]|uniref:hypothetical protein n=1 Tax=Bacillus cereus group TaxID=86661 RepID=UPI000BF078E9|nr:hypothetical protein [Bacillus wiedmannii]PEL63293.1 hypothetical protein CN622_11040 [Bacillus wiedmannii]PEU21505.1 hypothetical protein CN526_26680 [Bacillus wiedmannii]PHC21662.1 hypothetical protein COF00_23280 [Bacillus wiedmannii]
MTILATVFVPEGIVMATDSRWTRSVTRDDGNKEIYTLTDNAQKLVTVRNSTVGISFCGDAFIDDKTISDFIRIFDISQVNDDDTVESIAYKLHDQLQKYDDVHPVFKVAGYDNDEPFVFSLAKKHFVRTNKNDSSGRLTCGANWDGDYEETNIFLQNIKMDYWHMPLKDAIDYAEFIVELNIKQQRFSDRLATCGGPIDILVITKDYTKFLKHKVLKP